MSEYEFHSGVAVEVACSAVGLQAKADYIKLTRDISILEDNYFPIYVEHASFVYVEKFDKLFYMEQHTKSTDARCTAKQLTVEDSVVGYEFNLAFYNGGTDFSEAFEDAVLSAERIKE